ncbi:galactokinase [uncultured Croceitalea sp.]|uniref:galactokinase n=1 Tax=uncultured Croceitalea sp. TaxID=1798908 RepID=UPI0033062E54
MKKRTLKIASPGRINLIGEHIDYNDGFVLPAAIDKCIYFTLRANGSENRCTIKSKGFDSILVLDLKSFEKGTEGWHNYVLGVIYEIQSLTDKVAGFDCEIESKVPVGSGVSSSAALECGLAYGLNELFDLGLDKWQLILIGQLAEHNFVGTKCGIMDQFASVMGKKDHMLLLDCRSLEYEEIPIAIAPYRLLLLNTNVAHNLSTGEYNVRRAQCAEGLELLAKRFQIEKSFRNVIPEMLVQTREELGETLYDRCSYVVEETNRVLEVVKALKNNDLETVGALMYQTHEGLSKKYEVSCPELDFLVDFSKNEPQVLGARMMGGGFGGCTLNIIHEDVIDQFVQKATAAYQEAFDIELTSFETVPSQGTSLIRE